MSYPIPLERGKVLEFARATQSANPAYSADEPVIPATFLTTARLVWEPREENPMVGVGLDLRRVLHGEEEYAFTMQWVRHHDRYEEEKPAAASACCGKAAAA